MVHSELCLAGAIVETPSCDDLIGIVTFDHRHFDAGNYRIALANGRRPCVRSGRGDPIIRMDRSQAIGQRGNEE